MKPNYYRDVWILGPSTNDCPGSFPRGFIPAIKRKWWGQKRLWVCSGGFKDPGGVCIDIRPETRPDIIADAQQLPFEDSSFDFVMADPPYSEAEAGELYGTAYPSMVRLLNEMYRVCTPTGLMLFLHRLCPCHEPRLELQKAERIAVVGIGTLAAWTNIRALTVFRKQRPLESWTKVVR